MKIYCAPSGAEFQVQRGFASLAFSDLDDASNMTWNCVANDSKTNDTLFGSLMDETKPWVVGDRNGLHLVV